MSGANQQSLVTNINWLTSTYKITHKTQQQAPNPNNPNNAAPKPAGNGFKIYSDDPKPFYFQKNQKWETPISKINQHFTTAGIFKKPGLKDAELALKNVQAFGKTSSENKMVVVDKIIEHAPLDDATNLVPILDFLRIAALDEKVNEFICENLYDLFLGILRKYFLDNDFNKEQNPKAVRIVTWRLAANLTKFESGTDFLFSEYEAVLLAAQKALLELHENSGMVKAVTMTLNNLLFAEYGLECEEEIKFELVQGLVANLNNKDENTVIASLNIICRICKGNEALVKRVNEELPMLFTKTDVLRYIQNANAKSFTEDLLKILKVE